MKQLPFQSLIIVFILILATGCTTKEPVSAQMKPTAVAEQTPTAKEPQVSQKVKIRKIYKIDYYRSMAVLEPEVKDIKELEQMLEAFPPAVGKLPEVSTEEIVADIRANTLKNLDPYSGRSLPLTAHWSANASELKPDFVLSLIEEGHRLLPSWSLQRYFSPPKTDESYYQNSLKRAAQLNLPIILDSTAWEDSLLDDPAYSTLPADENPAIVTTEGTLASKLSPFGPTALWYEVGRKWANTHYMQQMQAWYPNPPLILIFTHNKIQKLQWNEVEMSQRYLDLYGTANSGAYNRILLSEAWLEKYHALQDGFRDGLTNNQWKTNALFVGQNALGTPLMNRSDAPQPLAWDIESRNLLFTLNETWRENPDLWWGFPLRQGHLIDTAERYRGFVKLALWMLRPGIVRRWEQNDAQRASIMPLFQEIVDSVDMIHNSDLLQAFWLNGELVQNSAREHPYKNIFPADYTGEYPWFFLQTSLDPPEPWSPETEIPVWAIALTKSHENGRQWLLFAQSPQGVQHDVTIVVPGYGEAVVDTSPEGNFFLLDEMEFGAAEKDAATQKEITSTVQQPEAGTQPEQEETMIGGASSSSAAATPQPETQASTQRMRTVSKPNLAWLPIIIDYLLSDSAAEAPLLPTASEPILKSPTVQQEWGAWVDGEFYGARDGADGPIGGGEGYLKNVTEGDADFVVTSYTELVGALTKATGGNIIYIPGNVTINFSGKESLDVPANVTIASDRGINGSPGALLYRDLNESNSEIFYIETNHPDVRLTGLRLQGSHTDRLYDVSAKMKGIRTWGDRLQVDNCELSGFSIAAIEVGNATDDVNISYNYIHSNQMDGYGYGVLVNRGNALVSYNKFDRNRHDVSGNGIVNEDYSEGSAFEAHDNISGQNTNAYYDMHGTENDGNGGIGGKYVKVYNNYMPKETSTSQVYAINLRGYPTDGPAEVHHNYISDEYDAVPDPVIQTYFTDRTKTVQGTQSPENAQPRYNRYRNNIVIENHK